MIRSDMISQYRLLANDRDTANPFYTDAQVHAELDNWQIDLAAYLLYPRAIQTISFAVGEGGSASTKNLTTNVNIILRVMWEPSSGSDYVRLLPSNEFSIADKFPDWRNFSNGKPAYYVLGDAPTAQAAAFPLRTITTERPTDAARTMRIHYVQSPAASTDGTLSPVFQPQFHVTGVYYAAWKSYLPRNKQKADEYEALYRREARRLKDTFMKESQENMAFTWDLVQAGGAQAEGLTRG